MTEMTAIYMVWHGESSLVAVARTEAEADAEISRLTAEGIRQEIDCSVEPEEEVTEWREEMLAAGVAEIELAWVTPPVERLVREARERAEARYREYCWYAKRPVPLIEGGEG